MKLSKNKVYYFASPYSSPDPEVIESRYAEQGRLVAHLIKEHGLLIVNPIEMCHNLSKRYGLPGGYEYWKSRDRKLISLSDGIIVAQMDGWEESIGVTDEIRYANLLGKPVFTIDPQTMHIGNSIKAKRSVYGL
jgi:hypothetical protein